MGCFRAFLAALAEAGQVLGASCSMVLLPLELLSLLYLLCSLKETQPSWFLHLQNSNSVVSGKKSWKADCFC